MEIERKFLIDTIPYDLDKLKYHTIEQAYLCTEPVVRIRREDDKYYMNYKGKGLMIREEYNLDLNKEAYEHLLKKADGLIIKKKRYLIPIDEAHTIELDIFAPPHAPLILAEVEFASKEDAENFECPSWFKEDVTNSGKYHNSNMIYHTL